jgi:effector-binding domain-containing protein
MKFDIEKSIVVEAPLEKVREYVEDFNLWNSWSPWTILEPDCNVQVEGNPKSKGHSMAWSGEIIGSGRNTLDTYSDYRLDYKLEFLKPWKSKADVYFEFEELGDSTKVIWGMHSSMPFFLFFMIKMMKNMVGMDYERGLTMLKAMVEEGSLKCSTENKGSLDYKGFSYVGIQRTCSIEDMPKLMQKDMEKIVQDVVIEGKKGARHWVSIYPKFDMKSMQGIYISAISDEGIEGLDLGDEYVRGEIKDSKAIEVSHSGSYDFLSNAWSMGMMFFRAKKMKSNGYPFEQYWNSPLEVTPEELQTSVYFPHK